MLHERAAHDTESSPGTPDTKAHYRLIIVGAGFAGATLLRNLPPSLRSPEYTLLIDSSADYTYLPLIHEVATGRLSAKSTVFPNANLCAGRATFLKAEVKEISPDSSSLTARTPEGAEVEFCWDHLVVASGASSVEPPPGIADAVLDFWAISDALRLRSKLAAAWDAAAGPKGLAGESETGIAVIGGGTTGVELACEIGALYRDLAKSASIARRPDPMPKVTLFEASDRLMGWLDPYFHERAMESLTRLGIEVKLNAEITSASPEALVANGGETPARTKVWTAGLAVNGLASTLPGERDPSGRLRVTPHLTLPEHPNIYVPGDASSCEDPRLGSLPPTASVAVQQGPFIARDLGRRLGDYGSTRRPRPTFDYFDRGYVVSLGPDDAVADALGRRLEGRAAHRLYQSVLLYYLRGRTSRTLTASEWAMRRLGRLGF